MAWRSKFDPTIDTEAEVVFRPGGEVELYRGLRGRVYGKKMSDNLYWGAHIHVPEIGGCSKTDYASNVEVMCAWTQEGPPLLKHSSDGTFWGLNL